MKVSLERKNNEYLFEGIGPNQIPVQIDNKTEAEVKGASPMELLLMGVGGCSAIDVISILKKQRQEITSYKTEVEGVRKEVEQAKPFSSIHVTIYLEGKIDANKAKKAADLSFQKYCSVSLTLEPQVAVTYDIIVNGVKTN
ncbi:MAG TPA: OsmC family peroxiredoxin [Flavobacteriaceae bacterium]|jgi:putative redox protein|nr:disulfide bond formation regulator [Flavobacteriaceae bacterium]MAM30447.1 disulfide bond formation regulator [Flavobacteriaceae bacterium]MAY53845.1 disulfide bond formation regulator [Flavobacteriaceae bacterium]HBR54948.1 disulfide bond formation regulator [Flavobacteriaceae bacterium]HIB49569.1 OsmC family peroxiredoxin [Flavobacteriaceae bacterium]|tara:strand:- start:329 stop:751 length:423 start_codon:yes stop_codon:yes gene_type:complete